MGSGIKAQIIKIGNSRGIRIPKVLLDQAKLGNEIEMEVKGGALIIRSPRNPRRGWDEQFFKMSKLGDDRLSDYGIVITGKWDQDEWEW
jgi:antitoxin MazE